MEELSIISSLLQQLLSNHNRVSLPGLGAFVVNHTPATFIKGGKGMLPPGKQIAFLSTETWNDGFLEQAFGKQQGVTHEEAVRKLALFAGRMNGLLEAGKRIEFPGFGTMRMTDDHELRFTAENTQQFSPDSFGLLEIEMSPVTEQPLNKVPAGTVTPVLPPKKHRCSVVCWIVLLLFLLSAGVYIFREPMLKWIENMSYTPEELAYLHSPRPSGQEQPALPSAPPPTAPAVVPAEEVVPEPVKPAAEVEKTPATTVKNTVKTAGRSQSLNKYHIMVARFDNEAAANLLAKQITDTEGYICLVLHTGGNEPYKVSILRYVTLREAQIILNGIKKTDGIDFQNAWVEKY